MCQVDVELLRVLKVGGLFKKGGVWSGEREVQKQTLTRLLFHLGHGDCSFCMLRTWKARAYKTKMWMFLKSSFLLFLRDTPSKSSMKDEQPLFSVNVSGREPTLLRWSPFLNVGQFFSLSSWSFLLSVLFCIMTKERSCFPSYPH